MTTSPAAGLSYDPAGGMPREADYALMEQPGGTGSFASRPRSSNRAG